MTVPILFNRKRLGQRRDRAAPYFAQHDFLLREAVLRAEESLATITRTFPRMVTFGAALPVRAGTTASIHCDLSPHMLRQGNGLRVAVDEEWLPFAENSIDAIVSIWGLHWVNDLPGTLSQMRRALKPDGCFLAILPGAETLRELRQSLAQAEAELTGGMHPRVAPFPDVREAGALLQRIGFTLPVASSETITATYPDMTVLMHELRSMGENAVFADAQKGVAPRSLFARAAAYYETYRDDEGRIPATFEFITLTGWKPVS